MCTRLPDECIVIRDGQQISMSALDLVPGDLILFKSGTKLPADVRFIQLTADAAFDRSVLTGEVVPLRGSIHSTDDNYLETACIGLAGTHCTSGTGQGIVVDTGETSDMA
jgi:sodium/potassium-transporting ATPase subunit alpha